MEYLLAPVNQFVIDNGGAIAVTVLTAQGLARAIPDNKDGLLGLLRNVAKVVGAYTTPDLKKVQREVDVLSVLAASDLDQEVSLAAVSPVTRKPRKSRATKAVPKVES
jgi:hypothetical protein